MNCCITWMRKDARVADVFSRPSACRTKSAHLLALSISKSTKVSQVFSKGSTRVFVRQRKCRNTLQMELAGKYMVQLQWPVGSLA